MKEFISVKEAAALWGVSERRVHKYCETERISGVCKYGNYWLIPADAQKPRDMRTKSAGKINAPGYSFYVCADLPKNRPEQAFINMDAKLRPLAEADFAFRQGDCEAAKELWRTTERESSAMLSVASLASAAAVSSGDYALYGEMKVYFDGLYKNAKSDADRYIASLPETLVAVSMALPDMAPDWLKNRDFSMFPPELYPFLLYLLALHLRNIRSYDAMLSVASSTLLLCGRRNTFTWLDVYLGVLCTEAALVLKESTLAERYMNEAVALAMPYGFIAPFADHLGLLGISAQTAIGRNYAEYLEPTRRLWEKSFKNWVRFHNSFSRENITTILNAQEYQVACLIVNGNTYAQAAKKMYLSVSRVKQIITAVYAKLYIRGKGELHEFIM